MAGTPDNTPLDPAAEASTSAAATSPTDSDTLIDPSSAATSPEMVRCALTGELIAADEAYWAPPLITFEMLIGTFFKTLFTAPSNLKAILFSVDDDVPYAPHVRKQLAQRRTREQLKLLALLLVILAVMIGILILVSGNVTL